MHIKKLLFSLLFVFHCYSAFSFSLNEIKDIEKIRWINCGDGFYDLPLTDKIEILFTIYPAKNYYKIFDLKEKKIDVIGEGEQKTIRTGTYYLLYEFKDSFYVTNLRKSHYDFFLTQGESFFSNNRAFLYSIIKLNDPNSYLRIDNKNFSYNELCTKYYKKNNKNLYTIVECYDTNNYVATISITDNNQTIKEQGTHFLTYDSENNTFYSDALFCKKDYKFNNIANDNFLIKILKYDANEKLLLLESSEYTRPYVPVEDFFTKKTSKVILSKSVNEKAEIIKIYNKPSFDSEIKKTYEGNKRLFVNVISSNKFMEEHNNKISKWVQIQVEDGVEGWVWGRDLSLFEENNNYDYEKVQRYTKYNTIKK